MSVPHSYNQYGSTNLYIYKEPYRFAHAYSTCKEFNSLSYNGT